MTHGVLLEGKLFLYLPLLLLAFLFIPSSARAQDMFEIQVYPYETVAPRHTMFEFHMNFFPSGTKTSENGKYPVHHQFHFTTEITHGITEHFELAGYIVTAWAPEHGFKLAGARVRPRFRLPEKWRLPFKFSLSTVARPVAVEPRMRRPSLLQWKCSFQFCWRGCRSGTSRASCGSKARVPDDL